MLMIVSIHYQPTEEIHHVLDFHSDNHPWFRAGGIGAMTTYNELLQDAEEKCTGVFEILVSGK